MVVEMAHTCHMSALRAPQVSPNVGLNGYNHLKSALCPVVGADLGADLGWLWGMARICHKSMKIMTQGSVRRVLCTGTCAQEPVHSARARSGNTDLRVPYVQKKSYWPRTDYQPREPLLITDDC